MADTNFTNWPKSISIMRQLYFWEKHTTTLRNPSKCITSRAYGDGSLDKRPCCVNTRTWIWTFSTHLKVECGCGCLSSDALEGQRQVDLWALLASQCNWNRGFRFSERLVSQNKVECERKESSEAKETEGQIETKCDTWSWISSWIKENFLFVYWYNSYCHNEFYLYSG